ncbi:MULTISPECIES: hypothetical protein [Gemmobacter]|jgi:hypothetical protein|uniref:Response regulatory domain-containing protein n=2 Tax=Gemmobacter TaxID=204456 RepID=A0A2T6BBH6_9RHOB|nr:MULTISPECIES: hypothetical protein [Gemmobacter]OJY27356.1 MAG: hypothetical protein BGP11_14895 [Rhodobacterales bacterium 65-51]PTX53424.1 hypothetical protein C8N34_101340 [Gemmobacter caeni]TWJ05535.1 hypothetical protein IQ03_00338 [Gemmobacter caeni]GHC15391.1 hypothetical protein GCM10007291_11940 [Gemmobacter nanjingensis]
MRRLFLVVDPVRLVAEDLGMLIGEADRMATVLVATEIEAALAELADAVDLAAAFLNLPFATARDSGLLERIAALGGRYVSLRASVEALPGQPPPLVLDLPFSDESVAGMLRQLR